MSNPKRNQPITVTQKPGTDEIKKIDFNEDLILDTGATFNSVKNKSLLAGVYTEENPIQMCTNTGE